MDLLLWRHAEAEDIHAGGRDHERKLTTKGKRQAQKIADWLALQLPQDARILVSPALRTVQTAEALKRKFEISEQLSTRASLSDHLAAARWPDNGNVLLVGHQPTLGQIAALLMSGHPSAWEIRKGALWWLRSAPEGGKLHATLRVAMLPGMLE
ncbi:MAG: histidine phosphatase family protein [Georgfuchsia sp.]